MTGGDGWTLTELCGVWGSSRAACPELGQLPPITDSILVAHLLLRSPTQLCYLSPRLCGPITFA